MITTDYSATTLDTPERIAAIVESAKARSIDEARLIWVASFDAGPEWGTGRCWFNTDVEPLPTDRIEGTAHKGVYTPVAQR